MNRGKCISISRNRGELVVKDTVSLCGFYTMGTFLDCVSEIMLAILV